MTTTVFNTRLAGLLISGGNPVVKSTRPISYLIGQGAEDLEYGGTTPEDDFGFIRLLAGSPDATRLINDTVASPPIRDVLLALVLEGDRLTDTLNQIYSGPYRKPPIGM